MLMQISSTSSKRSFSTAINNNARSLIICSNNKGLLTSHQRFFSTEKKEEVKKAASVELDLDELAKLPPGDPDKVPKPTSTQLRVYALQCAVPMVGFGFMDNIIMIQVGDLIDSTLGVTFGLATITAAAMGQVCSDVSGVAFGGVVDAFFTRMGLPVSDMTAQQLTLPKVRFTRTFAMAVGVLSGCLLGMTSLLFMDLEKAARLKKQKELAIIFATLAEEGSELCNVERCTLYIVEDDKTHLWSAAKSLQQTTSDKKIKSQYVAEFESAAKAPENAGKVPVQLVRDALIHLKWSLKDIAQVLSETEDAKSTKMPLAEATDIVRSKASEETRIELKKGGTKHWVVHTKELLNLQDINKDMRFQASNVLRSVLGMKDARSVLISPVIDEEDEEQPVIGLVEMINKKDENGHRVPFDEEDEKLIKMLCHHCATFITQVEDD